MLRGLTRQSRQFVGSTSIRARAFAACESATTVGGGEVVLTSGVFVCTRGAARVFSGLQVIFKTTRVGHLFGHCA